MKFLLVEDDTLLADGLAQSLGRLGLEVIWAATAAEAEAALLGQAVDLVLLDLGLPDRDGLDVLKALRRRGETIPVLILTARDDLDDRVRGLELGADDYLVKPFALRELEVRIQALIRRSYHRFGYSLGVGRLVLSPSTRQLLVDDGQSWFFSQREFTVLELLWIHAGQVVSKDRIARRLADRGEEPSDNAIEILICRLRRRLKTLRVNIRTLRGLGYLLEVEDV